MKNRYYIFVALVPLLLAACTAEDGVEEPDTGKTPILVGASMSGPTATAETRADEGSAFSAGVEVRMQIVGSWTSKQSDSIRLNATGTTLAAESGTPTTNGLSYVNPNTPLYWDDFGTNDASNTAGRNAGLRIYAIACPDGASTPTSQTDFTNVTRNLELGQTASSLTTKDLMISNNVNMSNTYKFGTDKGVTPAALVFKHALSKITVQLFKGDGFTDSEITGTNLKASIVLSNLGYKGSVNAITGAVSTTATGDITMSETSVNTSNLSTEPYATFNALAMPNSSTAQFVNAQKIMTITVNGNVYNLNGDAIVSAINTAKGTAATSRCLEPGTNYIVKVTIAKTKVNATATALPWSDITSSAAPSNGTAATFSAITGSTDFTQNYALWSNWSSSSIPAAAALTGFSQVNTFTYAAGTGYSEASKIYWPNNQTYYHFRALSPTETAVTTDATNGDYVTLSTKTGEVEGTADDVMFGAPYASTTAIINSLGPTTTPIAIVFKHKMAKVNIILKSESDDANQVVDISGATVNVTAFPTGYLRMGDGSIAVKGTETTYSPSYSYDSGTKKGSCTIGVVPQTTTGLSFTITANGNVYPINNVATLTDGTNPITFWQPGMRYTYTLNLLKTGVGVSATVKVVAWGDVSSNDNVIIQ
jgi:hypothetical protein